MYYMGPTFIMFAVISILHILEQRDGKMEYIYTHSSLKDIHSHKQRLDRTVKVLISLHVVLR